MDFRHRRPPEIPDLDTMYARLNADQFPLDMTRRRFVRNGAAFLTSMLLANEGVRLIEETTYRSNGTELQMVGGENIDSPLLAVSFGGLGSKNDYWASESLYNAGDNKIPTAEMIYDNVTGLNFLDMAKVLQESQKDRKFKYLILDLDSEGTMIGLYAALCAGIPLVAVISDSGIMKIGNVQTNGMLTAKIVNATDNGPFKPFINLAGAMELALKDLYCYFRDNNTNLMYPGMPASPQSLLGLPHELFTLPQQMANGGSPMLQQSEVFWANVISLRNLTAQFKHKGIITRDTEAHYIQSRRDNVIDPNESYHDLRDWFLRFRVHMHRHFMAQGGGHADVFATAAVLRKQHILEHILSRYSSKPKPSII